MHIASFENVSKKFGERLVFDKLSFKVKRGGRYGLLGPNGSGKSTLLRLLAGNLKPDSGKVLCDGLESWKQPGKLRSFTGLLPEKAPLIAELTPFEHLKLAARLKGLNAKEMKDESENLISLLSLSSFLNSPCAVLSLGQKRRVALASALLGSPSFLILDEPSSGLDPEESHRLLTILKNLPQNLTLLASSHILTEIYNISNDVIILAPERLAFLGAWDKIVQKNTIDEASLREKYLSIIKSKKSTV